MTRPTRLRTGPKITEADWQRKVTDYAKLTGWRCVHIRPARVGERWVTPYQGDAGLPDLVLARDGRVLLVELKSGAGKATLDQRAWLAAAGPNGFCWSPRDWPEVEFVLKRRRPVAA